MQTVSSFFKKVASGASMLSGGSSLKGRRAFNAYHSQDYESMARLCATMSPAQFLKEVREDDINILHHIATEDNYDALVSLCALPYFKDVVNDDSNEEGWTPLLTACAKSNKSDLKLIKLLVESGAGLSKPKRGDGLLPIHFAASNNDVHLLDYILTESDNAKTAVNLANEEGWTPAHFAGFLNNFDSLNLLIENGAEMTARNVHNLTAYDEIIRNDHQELFECVWLHAKHVKRDLNVQGSFGFVHLAAGQQGSRTLQFLLEKCKESPNQICNNHDQASPLHFAVLASNVNNMKLLMRYGASPNSQDSLGNTPMHMAVAQQSLAMVRVLDNYGADARIKNMDDISAIDVSITENIRDVKLHYMANNKYKRHNFSARA